MVASLGDIIASKEWADRPKDREALQELHGLAHPGVGAADDDSISGEEPTTPDL